MATAITLAVLLTLMLGAFYGICRVDARAIPGVLATAALIIAAGAYVALLLAL